MAGKKINVLNIPGYDGKLFENIFCGYVKTGREESEGVLSDYAGALDADGHLLIARKGKDGKGYESKLEGTVGPDAKGENTVLKYGTSMSLVTLVSFFLLTAVFLFFLVFTLVRYFAGNAGAEIYWTVFFGIGFFALLPGVAFRLECRSLEKALNKIVGEYVSVLEKRKAEQ